MEVGQEIEDVLQLVEDGVVHGQFPRHHFLKVVVDVLKVFLQTLEGVKLAADALAECAHCLILDVSEGEGGGGGGGGHREEEGEGEKT